MLQVVMANEAGLNPFQDMLDCSICQEEMKTARVLPCGHSSMCLEKCVQDLVRGPDLPCPTCRTNYKITKFGVNGILKNVFVNSSIDATH